MSRWLVSPAFDLGLLMGPAAVALGVALTLPDGAELGFAGWLLLVVAVDVAHVWASLYRSYLDPAERAARSRLLWAVPLGSLVAASALCSLSEALFWTVLAYFAVWHFIKQQIGFVALYRARQGLPGGTLDARVERAAVWAVTGFPILWWHAHLPRSFHWFLEGDFVPGLPVFVLWPAGVAAAAAVVAHVVLRVRSGVASPGRDLWLGLTAAIWFGGILVTNGDLAFTATNVLLHGVPYLALVAWVGRRQWQVLDRGPARRSLFFGLGILGFALSLLALALLEEAAWDALVWHDHEALFGVWSPPSRLAAWAVPLLAVPQITHYVLDGFLWKLGPNNPRLRAALLDTP